MRTIFHIGHHKTGTTSLQLYLAQNSYQLAMAGILYPWVEFQGASFAQARAYRREDKPGVPSINVREPHNALAFSMLADAVPRRKVPLIHPDLPETDLMLAAIRNQIRELDPKHVVLCSEVMTHFGKTAEDQITRLRGAFDTSKELMIWCTLRRPDEQLTSWHGQQMRFGNSPKPLSDDQNGLDVNWLHFDYRGVIEPWVRLIPEAALVLRPYREVMKNGGSVEDFKKGSGIDFPSSLIADEKMNVSYHPAAYPLFRAANAQLPNEMARQIRHRVARISGDLDLPRPQDIELFGEASRAKMVQYFSPIHQYLSSLTGRAKFFEDIEDMAICKPVGEMEAFAVLMDQLTNRRLGNLPQESIDFVEKMRKEASSL